MWCKKVYLKWLSVPTYEPVQSQRESSVCVFGAEQLLVLCWGEAEAAQPVMSRPGLKLIARRSRLWSATTVSQKPNSLNLLVQTLIERGRVQVQQAPLPAWPKGWCNLERPGKQGTTRDHDIFRQPSEGQCGGNDPRIHRSRVRWAVKRMHQRLDQAR